MVVELVEPPYVVYPTRIQILLTVDWSETPIHYVASREEAFWQDPERISA